MKKTKLILIILTIFIVGMTMGIAVSEPVNAKTFKTHGWKYKVSDKKWKTLKKQAKKNWGGRGVGYSYKYVKVTLHKKGHHNFKSKLYCRYDNYGAHPYLSNAPYK